jgi:hypothetical protein
VRFFPNRDFLCLGTAPRRDPECVWGYFSFRLDPTNQLFGIEINRKCWHRLALLGERRNVFAATLLSAIVGLNAQDPHRLSVESGVSSGVFG